MSVEYSINEEPFCEHCRELEPYDIIYLHESIGWCEVCMESIEEIPQSMKDKAAKESKEKKKVYYQEKLDGLEDTI